MENKYANSMGTFQALKPYFIFLKVKDKLKMTFPVALPHKIIL
jgi:hypothetical protein